MLQEKLDDGSFESFKSGLIAKLLEKDPSLSYETNRFWNQIVDKRYIILYLKRFMYMISLWKGGRMEATELLYTICFLKSCFILLLVVDCAVTCH